MAVVKGTNVAAPVVPFDDADQYPTHDAVYGLGGYREVANSTARDAIPVLRKRDGMLVFCQDTRTTFQWNSGSSSWSIMASPRFDIPFFVSGKPASAQIVLNWIFAASITLPASLTGSQFHIATNPAAVMTFALSKISGGSSSSIGSVSFGTSGAATITFASAITFAAGDILSLVAPSPQDTAGSDVSMVFVGSPS